MEKLKQFLAAMASEDDRKAFAARCGVTLGAMRNVIYGLRKFDAAVCVVIELATEGAVSRRDLRPGDWHRIWPELVTAEHPAPVAADAPDSAPGALDDTKAAA